MEEKAITIQGGHTPKVQLGCGTLLLIALIVMIFSGRGSERELKREIEELNTKIDRLEQKIDALSSQSESAPAAAEPATGTSTP